MKGLYSEEDEYEQWAAKKRFRLTRVGAKKSIVSAVEASLSCIPGAQKLHFDNRSSAAV